MRALMWFRADLRTTDNTALAAATKAATSGVVAAFLISPIEWRGHNYAPVRIDFMLRTLAELSASLARLNIPLLIAHAATPADIPETLLSIAREHRCDALFFNREYELDETRRDRDVADRFKLAGLRAIPYDDQCVLPPGSVLSRDGRALKVFTPFRRAWLAALDARGGVPTLASPRAQPSGAVAASPIPREVPGFRSSTDPSLWPAGESHALKRLAAFTAGPLRSYKQQRDLPASGGTSTLSPYLAIGAISPRQCLAAAAAANRVRAGQNPLDSGDASAVSWVSELIWREFYIHIIAAFPRLCTGRAFRPETENIPWSDDRAAFERWMEGRTGFPIVDAGMRQLLTTGWMHNRLRMITAMFLTKDLLINWRWGERHFMRLLIDGFFASNNGGWQWSASTGTDAAPYFRIFNPTSQGRACDPEGGFIRRHVPELAHLDARAIHAPHDPKSGLAPLELARLDYPPPMVDHAAARDRTLEAFRSLKV